MFNKDTAQRIKDAAQIYDVVAQFVTLKKSGPRYIGLCPFHNERTPSFYVTPAKGIYKCFGCGESGDAVAFLMHYKRMPYPEALQYLAAMYNIETGDTTGRPTGYSAPPPIAPRPPAHPPAPPSVIPKSVFKSTLTAYRKNNFAAFLIGRFGTQSAADLISRYAIGTALNGKVVFWYIDSRKNIRSGKTILYDPTTGKRNRDKNPDWVHTNLRFADFKLSLCWYGEHLLTKRPGAPVAIVESEKSAIIGSLYLTNFIWLAVGGIGGLPSNPDRWEVLKSRKITLYPDCDPPGKDGKSPFDRWSERAEAMRKEGYNISVSDLLEHTATEAIRAQKWDIADYLLQFDPANFQSAQDDHHAAPQPAQTTNAATAEPIPTAQSEADKNQFSDVGKMIPAADTGQVESLTGAAKRRRFTDRHTAEIFTLLMTPEGYPAAWDDPTPDAEPPAALSAQEAADLMTGFGWDAVGTWQPMQDAAPDGWQDLPDLITFFEHHNPPVGHIADAGCRIEDPAKFIDAHLMTAQAQNGKRAYLPYIERLRSLKRKMEAA